MATTISDARMEPREESPSVLRLYLRFLLGRLTPSWAIRLRKPGPRHPPVYCVADLVDPPPQYQHVRRAMPAVGELEMLQAELYRCQTQSSNGNPIERELLDADVENLNRWIEQLEYIVYYDAATRIPRRYQKASFKTRVLGRIMKFYEKEI